MKSLFDASAYEIVMIVHDLHQRGYEQLRLFPGMSPNGMCWRWMIYPKVLMKDNRFELHGDCTPFECLRGTTGAAFPEEGQDVISADDFIRGNETYFDLAKGEDKAYAEWFKQIVEHAKNNAFPIAFEEFFDAEEWKFTGGEPLSYPPFAPVGIDTLTDELMIEYAKHTFNESSVHDLNEIMDYDGNKMSIHDIAEAIRKAIREDKDLVSHYDSDEDILEIFAWKD